MERVKGVAIGFLFFAIFFLTYFVISTPLYAALTAVFGEANATERVLSKIPYLMFLSLEILASALAGAFVAGWICGRLANTRSAPIAIVTFGVLATAIFTAGIVMESNRDLTEILMALSVIGVGCFLGAEFLTKAVERRGPQ